MPTAGLIASQNIATKLVRTTATSGTNPYENLGLVQDCGDGSPIIIILPPSDGYGTATTVAGCPATVNQSHRVRRHLDADSLIARSLPERHLAGTPRNSTRPLSPTPLAPSPAATPGWDP